MRVSQVEIQKIDAEKLLSAASPDGALLYVYMKCGNPMDTAMEDLHMSQSRFQCAAATLRQLGLYQEEKHPAPMGEQPRYTEEDIFASPL